MRIDNGGNAGLWPIRDNGDEWGALRASYPRIIRTNTPQGGGQGIDVKKPALGGPGEGRFGRLVVVVVVQRAEPGQ